MGRTESNLPADPVVQRDAEATRHSLSPTNSFRFLFEGDRGLPDLYEEWGGHGDGPPLHRHPWPSWELLLEGEIRVVAGDEEITLRAGDSLYLPPGVPHTYVVESDTSHVVGITLSDGRFAALQQQAVPLFQAEGGPDLEGIGALAAAHDVEILGPPLAAAVTAD